MPTKLWKSGSANYKKIIYVPHLQIIIDGRCFRIISHDYSASVMLSEENIIKFLRSFISDNNISAHFFSNFMAFFNSEFSNVSLLICEFKRDAQKRITKIIFIRWIEIDIIMPIRH